MTRVLANMVADLFHRGHLEFLKKAKNYEDDVYLIVGVHSDKAVASYKNNRKPVFCMDDRVEIIKACRYVDEIIPNANIEITNAFLDKHRIDIVIHGEDMSEILTKFMYKVPIARGIMRVVPYYQSISTTKIIEGILK